MGHLHDTHQAASGALAPAALLRSARPEALRSTARVPDDLGELDAAPGEAQTGHGRWDSVDSQGVFHDVQMMFYGSVDHVKHESSDDCFSQGFKP